MYDTAPKSISSVLLEASNSIEGLVDGLERIDHQNAFTKRGVYSFKVLTECPLVIMLLFQTYPYHYMQKNAIILLPSMMYFLSLNAPMSLSAELSSLQQVLYDLFSAQVSNLCHAFS